MSNSKSFVNKLQTQGRIAFTTIEFAASLSLSPTAAMHSLLRLRRKQEIASPVRGFHVILPPADRANGSRPAEEFVDYLMTYLKSSYYVAILSAAEIHGAAHQRPQMFQVIVTSRRRAIRCGNVRIQFLVKGSINRLPTKKHKVRTGYLIVGTPEITAFDLVAYQTKAAGIDNVATVLSELVESISAPKLIEVSKFFEIATVQRLGFILDKVGARGLANSLEWEVRSRAHRSVVLVPGKKSAHDVVTDKRWRIIVNDEIQPDI